VKEFVRKYGHDAGDDVLYFTGIHRAGNICEASGQTQRCVWRFYTVTLKNSLNRRFPRGSIA
jgi:GGDEF domain-containing protein